MKTKYIRKLRKSFKIEIIPFVAKKKKINFSMKINNRKKLILIRLIKVRLIVK